MLLVSHMWCCTELPVDPIWAPHMIHSGSQRGPGGGMRGWLWRSFFCVVAVFPLNPIWAPQFKKHMVCQHTVDPNMVLVVACLAGCEGVYCVVAVFPLNPILALQMGHCYLSWLPK